MAKRKSRWAKGELTEAVRKALGRKPQTVNEVATRLKANPWSVRHALGLVGKPKGAVKEPVRGKSAATYVRA